MKHHKLSFWGSGLDVALLLWFSLKDKNEEESGTLAGPAVSRNGGGGIAGDRALPLEVMGRTQQGQPGHKQQWFRAET